MIVDTSAIIAILKAEPDAEAYIDALDLSASTSMAAPTYLECKIVVGATREPVLSRMLDRLLNEAEIEVAVLTKELAEIAYRAYQDFGKGSGHATGLNWGDCMSYALAVATNQPLLWKGDDFSHTGVRSALAELNRG